MQLKTIYLLSILLFFFVHIKAWSSFKQSIIGIS